jgi:hypothetical protein
LKLLFEQGALSPFDSDTNGDTLLHVCDMAARIIIDTNRVRLPFAKINQQCVNFCFVLEWILKH